MFSARAWLRATEAWRSSSAPLPIGVIEYAAPAVALSVTCVIPGSVVPSWTGRVIAVKGQRAAPHMRGIVGDRQIYTEVVRADVSDVFAVLGRFPQSSPGMSQQVLGDVVPKGAQDISISGEVEYDQRSRIRVLTGPESCLDIVD